MPGLWERKQAGPFSVLKRLEDEVFIFATPGHYISIPVREVDLESKKATF